MVAAGGFNSSDFPSTKPHLIREATRSEDGTVRRQAVASLAQAYLRPLHAHLVHRRGMLPDRAEDLLQDFVCSRLLNERFLGKWDPERGRFRALLVRALGNFIRDRLRSERRRVRAERTKGRADEVRNLRTRRRTVSEVERIWAVAIVQEAVRRTRFECETKGGRMIIAWRIFEGRVVGPAFEGTPPLDYAHLVELSGARSPQDLSNLLVTAKRMFLRHLRVVVRETDSTGESVDEAIRELRHSLAVAEGSG